MNYIKAKKRDWLKDKISRISKRLENFDNCDMSRNGESDLIRRFCIDRSARNKRDIVIFDVGANVGSYSSLFLTEAKRKKLTPKIHAFEPSKPTFEKLRVALGAFPEIVLINFGLSDSDGDRILYADQNEDNSGGSSVYNRRITKDSPKMLETVHLKRLDGYIRDNRISHIDFMKIDVEGHELFVLKGMGDYLRPDFVDFIQFEFGGCAIDSDTSLKELTDLLEQRGFVNGKIMRHCIELNGHKTRAPGDYTYANYIAINPQWIKN